MTRIHLATVARAGTATALALSLTACLGGKTSDSNVYTLYRNSVVQGGNDARIHVATFDATDGATYNRENCTTAQELFQRQRGVMTRFWCERGSFTKG